MIITKKLHPIGVRVSSNDTTFGHLNGKLVAGSGINLTEQNNGSNETLLLSVNLGTGLISTDQIYEGANNKYFTAARARASISENVTGLDYNTTSGILSLTSGYIIPTTVSASQWDTAYSRSHVQNTDTSTLNTSFVISYSQSGVPSVNGSFQVRRGTGINASLLWDESTDRWKAGLLGSEIEIADVSSVQTLSGKTIDGDDNTVRDLALSALKTDAGNANKYLRRDGSGIVQNSIILETDLPSGINALKLGSGIDAVKIGTGTVDNTEFGYLDGVSSSIQNQLNSKQNIILNPITGTGTSGFIALFNSASGIIGVSQATAFNQNFETNSANIKMNGIVSTGILNTIARADHVHPTDTSRQTADATLTALANLDSVPGFVVETSADTFLKRSIQGTANRISVSNTSGVAGNVVVDIGSKVVTDDSSHVFTNKTFDANGTGNSLSNIETSDFASGVIRTSVNSGIIDHLSLPSAKSVYDFVTGRQALIYVTDTSVTPNLITVDPSPAIISYEAGLLINVKVNNTNTNSGVIINVNGLGDMLLMHYTYTNGLIGMPIGGIRQNSILTLVHDGTQFQTIAGLQPFWC